MKQLELNMATVQTEVKKATAKTAIKRKPAAKRKPAEKKVATKKPATRKKPVPRKAAKPSKNNFSTRAQETGRKAFLASLGFYARAFDQAQDQFSDLQDQLKTRRKKANTLYTDLVKRGEKVEKATKSRIDDIDMSQLKLERLTDRKKLEAQLEKAKSRFTELKGSIRFKTAA